MRVKKLLALLLSGAFFAGCLSGCDRTIIEHQFHTNTITDTVIVEIPVETESLYGFEDIIDLFEKQDIKVVTSALEMHDVPQGETVDNLVAEHNTCKESDIGAFYQSPGGTNIISASVKCKVNSLIYLDEAQNLANQIYHALINYINSNEWDWEQFKESLKSYRVVLDAVAYVGYNYNEGSTGMEACVIVTLTARY